MSTTCRLSCASFYHKIWISSCIFVFACAYLNCNQWTWVSFSLLPCVCVFVDMRKSVHVELCHHCQRGNLLSFFFWWVTTCKRKDIVKLCLMLRVAVIHGLSVGWKWPGIGSLVSGGEDWQVKGIDWGRWVCCIRKGECM